MRLLERKARDRRKVSPTEFGRLLVPHAESVVSELQNLKVQFDNLLGLRHTVLRFAATPTAMTRLIAPALAAFRTQHPKFRVQAMQMVLPTIISRLNEGVFDFIIADEPQEPLAEQYIVEPLITDFAVVICGPKHPLATAAPSEISAGELAKQRWIGFGPFMPTMAGFCSIFEKTGLKLPARFLETSSCELTIAELQTNRYLAVMPRELIRPQLRSGDLIELPLKLEPIEGWRISVIRRVDFQLSPAAEDFLNCLRAV